MASSQFKSTHSLPFEVAPWEYNELLGGGWERFRIGTCEGLCKSTDHSYEILAIDNTSPGNGHLNDVFDWFIHSCKRDKKAFIIRELWNEKFYHHLLNKRGFVPIEYSLDVELKPE